MTPKLSTQLTWQRHPVGVTSAFGQVDICIGEAGSSGPTLLITAGLHGDEGPWGAWAIRKLLDRLTPDDLRGRLRVVPVTNPLAMQADARCAPVDQLDLNRAFPGSADGSYTERVAHILTQHALKEVDFAIDLHGGGSWCVNAFVFEMANSEGLAASFPAPFIVRAPERSVTLTGWAQTQGVRTTAVEMGGRSQYEPQWAERIADGLHRALATAGVIDPAAAPPPLEKPAVRVGESHVLRPDAGGIFVPVVGPDQVGTVVSGGTVLGRMHDPVTMEVMQEFTAPYERTALMLLRPTLAQIEGGAMTYVIAEPAGQ